MTQVLPLRSVRDLGRVGQSNGSRGETCRGSRWRYKKSRGIRSVSCEVSLLLGLLRSTVRVTRLRQLPGHDLDEEVIGPKERHFDDPGIFGDLV